MVGCPRLVTALRLSPQVLQYRMKEQGNAPDPGGWALLGGGGTSAHLQ